MEKKERILWIDALKGFTIIFVIIGHVLLGYTNNNTFPEFQEIMLKINYWIYSWHMPLFMVISGFAFKIAYFKDKKLDKKRINKQILNLILIYFIFQFGLCLLKIIFNNFVDNKMDFYNLILNLLIPNNIMWYIWVLVIYYFILKFIYNQIDNFNIYVCTVILGIIIKIIDNKFGIILGIRNLFYCFQFFIFGIWLANKYLLKENFEMNKKINLFSWSYFIIYIFLLTTEYFNIFPIMIKIILELISAYSIIIILFRIFSKIKKLSFLILCGKESLVIYLLHTYFVTAIKAYVIRSNFLLAGIIIILTTVLSLIICLIIAKLSHKIKFLEYIFKPIIIFERLKESKNAKI